MGKAELTLHDQAVARRISLDEYWMPFTPNRDFKHEPKMVVRAEGMYYWNDRGERIIDASSGLFCCAAGHGRNGDRRRGQRAVARTRLRRAVHARASEAVRAGHPGRGTDAGRPEPHLLHQFRLRGGRHRDEDRAGLPPGARPGRPHHVRVARARLPRREFRRRLAVRNGQQPPHVRPDAAGHRAHAAHAPEGELLHPRRGRARRRTGRGPAAHGQRSTVRRTSPPASSSRSPAPPAAWCRPRATSRGCARSATSTASCWCSTRSSPASAAPAGTSPRRASA